MCIDRGRPAVRDPRFLGDRLRERAGERSGLAVARGKGVVGGAPGPKAGEVAGLHNLLEGLIKRLAALVDPGLTLRLVWERAACVEWSSGCQNHVCGVVRVWGCFPTEGLASC